MTKALENISTVLCILTLPFILASILLNFDSKKRGGK